MLRRRLAPLFALLLVVTARSAAAQTNCTQADKATFNAAGTACAMSHTVSATVPYLAAITASTAAVSLGTITAAQMTAGFSDVVAGPTLQVAANFTYSLAATSGGFISTTKATSDLEVASNTTGTLPSAGFTGLGSSVALASSASATAASTTLHTYFRMKLNWAADAPKAYSATVTYTLTAP